MQLIARLSTFLLLIAAVVGCDDGSRATSGTSPTTSAATSPTTVPAIQADTGARATGGVFESASTQPAPPR